MIVEATAFSGGIVIAQVNELVDGKTTTLPRVDIPADWVSFVVKAPRPNFIEPLFTRDPAQISEIQVLMAMMASTPNTACSASTTASASTPRRSSCCCRRMPNRWASRARSAGTGH